MPGPAGDRAHVHAGRDQLRDHEVPKVMESAPNTEAAGKLGEAVGDAVGSDGPGAIRRMAEHVAIGGEGYARGQGNLDLLDSVAAQQVESLDADGNPALGVVPGPVLVDEQLTRNVDDAAVDQDLAVLEVDV